MADAFSLDASVSKAKKPSRVGKWFAGGKGRLEKGVKALNLDDAVTGITRLSPRVKWMAVGVVMVLFGLFGYALMEADDKPSMGDRNGGGQQNDKSSSEVGAAKMPTDLSAGVGNGRAGVVTPDSDMGLGPSTAPGSGGAFGVPTLAAAGAAGDKGARGSGAGPASTSAGPSLGRGPSAPTAPVVPQLDSTAPPVTPQSADGGYSPSTQRATSGSGEVKNFGGVGATASPFDPTAAVNAARNAAQQGTAAASANAGTAQQQLALQQGAANDQNLQARKEAFIVRAMQEQDDNYLRAMRQAPLSEFQVAGGSIVPGMMIAGTNSDLPGMLRGIVTENVCDSKTHRHILIPQYTVIKGYYDSQIAYGQARLLVVWNELVFPDTSSMSLKGMPAGDEGGAAGIGGEVDNHWLKLFGAALASSVVTAAVQLSQPPQQANVYGQAPAPSVSQTMASALGQQLGQASSAMTQKNLAIQPTITAPVGQRFVINVTKHMVFDRPYEVNGCVSKRAVARAMY